MKVLIFGATGMVGMGALLECLDDEILCSDDINRLAASSVDAA
jgi:nucleoside-diphosphate-sugar epimerase